MPTQKLDRTVDVTYYIRYRYFYFAPFAVPVLQLKLKINAYPEAGQNCI
jgi:hypothetical protein